MGKTADAPNYTGAAQQQSDASHVNQNGVVGSSAWTQGPDGKWTQGQSLNGGFGDAAKGYERQIAGQGALDLSHLSAIDTGAGAGQHAYDASYNQSASRLDPQFAQQHEALKAQLASQGLDPGSEAANNAGGNLGRQENDAYSGARNQAFGQGQQAQQQAFTQSMGARQQQLAELLKQRGMPMDQLQQIMGLMGGAQGVGAAGGPNYLGAAQAQGDFASQQADSKNRLLGSFFGAAGGAGAAALGAPAAGAGAGGGGAAGAAALCDERAKCAIERLPVEALPGVPFAVFEYRHAPGVKHLGVIAQDVQRVAPSAVQERGGLMWVNYAEIGRLQ